MSCDLNNNICQVYLDDLIIFSKTLDEHLERLKLIFERIRDCGMKLAPQKCEFLKNKVKYIGHIVFEKGIETDPAKTEKILLWPIPSNTDELRSFLGFAGYYRRFVNNFAMIAKPLNLLLCGEIPRKKSKRKLTNYSNKPNSYSSWN